ncbi:M4 family metallopeptidase [Stackebrandtia soli]|uniref:M4 family metallopeptidase n=1 Tax=Stackebrandtia soli TaxID=1892856 RepID=UPI0039E99C76
MRPTINGARLGACAFAAGLVAATLAAPAAADPPTSTDDVTALAVAGAQALIASDDSRLALSDRDDTTLVNVTTTLGLTFAEYERTHAGLPVVGGDFVIATDDTGSVAYAQSALETALALDDLTPAISARTISSLMDTAESPRLVVYVGEGTPTLAWETSAVTPNEDGILAEERLFVDADSGEVVGTITEVVAGTGNTYYNGRGGTVDFATTTSGSQYVMRDPNRPGVSCAPSNGSPYTDADDVWGNGTGTDFVTACVDAMYAAGQQWDMLAEWLDRDGINGSGSGYPMYVGLNMVNAYWTGSSAHFGRSSDSARQLTPTDIVAHELGHGIFQNTPGGSGGGNETGGLNEGAGDIFGALTEWYSAQPNDEPHDPGDYLVGEEGGLSSPGVPIRNMPNPAAHSHPSCWSTSIPGTEVHAGAGPINHWFYLLAEGTAAGGPGVPGSTTCNGTTMPGIGIETAGKVFMGALMGKTSSWTYAKARQAALSFAATTPLFSTCAEYNATKAAFDAVSVPTTGDPACSKGGEPGAPSASFTVDCDDATLTCTFDGTASTGESTVTAWAWDFGDGSTGTGSTATHTYAAGTYTATLTVTDAESQTGTATKTVTVGTDPGLCGGHESINAGSLSASGDSETYAYTAAAGVHEGCLDGPDGVDFDLELQKLSGSSWVTVARSISSGPDEDITYTGTAGEYRWVVESYRGTGDYTAGFTNP